VNGDVHFDKILTNFYTVYKKRDHKKMSARYPVCAGIVLKNDHEQYLMVLGRKANKWSFPKGHIESTEDCKTCAERETYEETGLRIVIPDDTRNCFTKKSVYYLLETNCILDPDTPLQTRDPAEVEKIEWFSKENLQALTRDEVNSDVWEFIKALKWLF